MNSGRAFLVVDTRQVFAEPIDTSCAPAQEHERHQRRKSHLGLFDAGQPPDDEPCAARIPARRSRCRRGPSAAAACKAEMPLSACGAAPEALFGQPERVRSRSGPPLFEPDQGAGPAGSGSSRPQRLLVRRAIDRPKTPTARRSGSRRAIRQPVKASATSAGMRSCVSAARWIHCAGAPGRPSREELGEDLQIPSMTTVHRRRRDRRQSHLLTKVPRQVITTARSRA